MSYMILYVLYDNDDDDDDEIWLFRHYNRAM